MGSNFVNLSIGPKSVFQALFDLVFWVRITMSTAIGPKLPEKAEDSMGRAIGPKLS